MSALHTRFKVNVNEMSDEALDQEIAAVKPPRNFSRLSVQLLEITLERVNSVITSQLNGHQEHIPEPEPNPQRFTGYIKYHKDNYVQNYEAMRPLRDLARLIRQFLPNMRIISDGLQRRYRELIEQRELRLLQRRIRAQMDLNNDALREPGLFNFPNEPPEDENEENEEIPLLENVDPLD